MVIYNWKEGGNQGITGGGRDVVKRVRKGMKGKKGKGREEENLLVPSNTVYIIQICAKWQEKTEVDAIIQLIIFE